VSQFCEHHSLTWKFQLYVDNTLSRCALSGFWNRLHSKTWRFYLEVKILTASVSSLGKCRQHCQTSITIDTTRRRDQRTHGRERSRQRDVDNKRRWHKTELDDRDKWSAAYVPLGVTRRKSSRLSKVGVWFGSSFYEHGSVLCHSASRHRVFYIILICFLAYPGSPILLPFTFRLSVLHLSSWQNHLSLFRSVLLFPLASFHFYY